MALNAVAAVDSRDLIVVGDGRLRDGGTLLQIQGASGCGRGADLRKFAAEHGCHGVTQVSPGRRLLGIAESILVIDGTSIGERA